MKFSANKKNGTTKFQAPIQIDFWIIPQMTKRLEYLPLEIGNIENVLTHSKLGYMKDEDFFVMDQPKDFFQGYEQTQRTMLGVLRKHKNWNERRNRYIFIVDRRHPKNMNNTKLLIPTAYDEK
eukprot:379932_1